MGQLDPTLKTAVDWMVQLRSGHAAPGDAQAFQAWRASNPKHEAAAQKLEQALQPFEQLHRHGVPDRVVRDAMLRARQRASRRAAITFGITGVAVAGLVARNAQCPECMLADGSTGFAQRSQEQLPDGSSLWLDARTAVDFDFSAARRRVELLRGRVLAEVVPAASGPLVLDLPNGELSSMQARIVAHAKGPATEVTVLDGSVDCTSASGEVVKATAGRRLLLPDSGAIQWAAARGTEGLWTRGQMALNDEPLGELVDAMQHYRRGVIQIDESAAQLRVSGLFSLDDTDATLRALVQTQPVRVREITRYWVQISAA